MGSCDIVRDVLCELADDLKLSRNIWGIRDFKLSRSRLEWAIDYRKYFEEINAKQRKSAEENNYTVYLKGLNVANPHGKY